MGSPKPEKLTKEWVRENLPTASAMADEFAAVFGSGLYMTWAKEGEHEVGKQSDETKYQVIRGDEMALAPRKQEPQARPGRK